MIRVEIYANMELLDEFQGRLKEKVPEYFYTIFPFIKGYGKKGYAFGDSIWPESNFCCVIMLNEGSDIAVLKNISDDLQRLSPQNSIKIFAYKIDMLL